MENNIENQFFKQINTNELCKLISLTKGFLCYAAPGIQIEPAKHIAELAQRIGPESIIIFLDIDEKVMRMGYGDIHAVQLLQDSGILLKHIPGLRNGLIVTDESGFSYTPTALFLEKEGTGEQSLNALRLMPEQIKEAMARLSPASKAIALAQAKTVEDKKKIEMLTSETQPISVDKKTINIISSNLEAVPPAKFDIARQVRVYEAYFQYVDISLEGAFITKKRITIPKNIQIKNASKELNDRLNTSVELIGKDVNISKIDLTNEITNIRNNFTKPINKIHGRIILKSALPLFKDRIKGLKENIEKYKKDVAENIQAEFDKTKEELIKLHLPNTLKNPPDSLVGLWGKPSEENVKAWLDDELSKVIPKADSIVSNIKLYESYKDVTYDTLKNKDFIAKIREAYPHIDWDQAHQEFLAAGEEEKSDSNKAENEKS